MPVTPAQHASSMRGIAKLRSSFKLPAMVKGAEQNIKTNISSGVRDLKTAIEGNKKVNGGKFKPLSLKGTY